MKYYLLGLVIAMLSVATHANQFKTSPPFGAVAGMRCMYQDDECIWAKVENKKVMQQTKSMTKIKATLRGGGSSATGNDPVSWGKVTYTVIAECSKTKPSLIANGQIDRLNVKNFPDVESADVNLYFLICHDYDNGVYDGAKRFKY